MDLIADIGRSALTVIALFVVLIAVPILFMFIFGIATSIDDRLDR
jgi:hypothetical protein